MATTRRIRIWWPEHSRAVGYRHLTDYGVIFLDRDGLPIDDEYLLEEVIRKYTGGIKP